MRTTIALVNGDNLYARAIKLATWSPFCHAAFDKGGRQFSAHVSGVGWADYLNDDKVMRFTVKGLNLDKALSIAETQTGKPYDWSAIAGIALHRDWREDDSFFCSELVAWACEKAGVSLLRFDHLNRVTPGQLALSPLLEPA